MFLYVQTAAGICMNWEYKKRTIISAASKTKLEFSRTQGMLVFARGRIKHCRHPRVRLL
jgi:hypothetical protein